jgi:hypothetical protein
MPSSLSMSGQVLPLLLHGKLNDNVLNQINSQVCNHFLNHGLLIHTKPSYSDTPTSSVVRQEYPDMPWSLFLVKHKLAIGLGQLISPMEWSTFDFNLKHIVKELLVLASPLEAETHPLGFFCKLLTLLHVFHSLIAEGLLCSRP